VGGYPGENHRMPVCCEVMRSTMAPGDQVVETPPSGKGAALTIRYRLPRGAPSNTALQTDR
jgi:5-methylcytosine-specific restriction protein A